MQKWFGWILLAPIAAFLIVWGVSHGLRSRALSSKSPHLYAAPHASASSGSETNRLYPKLKSAVAAMIVPLRNRAAQMAELGAAIASMAPYECSEGIRRFLDSGEDAQTGKGFKLRSDGSLEEAPTLRVWLLDYLSKTDPGSALEYARKVLAKKESADEWAVALRCLALLDDGSEGRSYLGTKTAELLT